MACTYYDSPTRCARVSCTKQRAFASFPLPQSPGPGTGKFAACRSDIGTWLHHRQGEGGLADSKSETDLAAYKTTGSDNVFFATALLRLIRPRATLLLARNCGYFFYLGPGWMNCRGCFFLELGPKAFLGMFPAKIHGAKRKKEKQSGKTEKDEHALCMRRHVCSAAWSSVAASTCKSDDLHEERVHPAGCPFLPCSRFRFFPMPIQPIMYMTERVVLRASRVVLANCFGWAILCSLCRIQMSDHPPRRAGPPSPFFFVKVLVTWHGPRIIHLDDCAHTSKNIILGLQRNSSRRLGWRGRDTVRAFHVIEATAKLH